MTNKKKYQGIIIPAITPLTADYKLDAGAVERVFSNFRQHKVLPFILGTTGESALLPLSLKTEYIKLAGELKQPGEMLYTGIASNCLEESIELAKLSFDNNADAVVATLPSYYKLTDSQMKRYFERLIEACNGPLVLYNIPATVHMSIPLHIIDELSYHENVVAVKDSERSDQRLNDSLNLWADRRDFSYFLGWAARSAEALINGADGVVPSTGNLHPEIYSDMLQAVLDGNHTKARALQVSSDELGNVYQYGRTLGESLWALKVLMNERGLCLPYVMPPLEAMSDDEKFAIIESLGEFLKVRE